MKYVFLFLIFFTFSIEKNAIAGGFYLETGVGTSEILSGGALFNEDELPTPGMALNFLLGQNLSADHTKLQFHLGLKMRQSTGSVGSKTLAMRTLYPLHFKLESKRMYVGFSGTPLLWAKNDINAGLGGYSKISNALSFVLEYGLIWRVTPFFHLAGEGGGEFVTSEAGIGPSPSLQVSLQMRFYFDSDYNRKNRLGDYEGWRYPFGIHKDD